LDQILSVGRTEKIVSSRRWESDGAEHYHVRRGEGEQAPSIHAGDRRAAGRAGVDCLAIRLDYGNVKELLAARRERPATLCLALRDLRRHRSAHRCLLGWCEVRSGATV